MVLRAAAFLCYGCVASICFFDVTIASPRSSSITEEHGHDGFGGRRQLQGNGSATASPTDLRQATPSPATTSSPATLVVPTTTVPTDSGGDTPAPILSTDAVTPAPAIAAQSPTPSMGAITPAPATAAQSPSPAAPMPTENSQNLGALLASKDDYGGFSNAVAVSTQLSARLSSSDSVTTVFAPDNGAFRNMDPVLTSKLQTPEYAFHFANLIDYHALDGVSVTTDFAVGTTLTMLNNESLQVGIENATRAPILYNPYNASLVGRMVERDVPASNGILTGITGDNGPLMPDFVFLDVPAKISSVPSLSNFTEWLILSDIDLSLLRQDGITVLAPGNQAFARAESPFLDYYSDPDNAVELQSLLMYHIIPRMLPTTLLTAESTPTLGLDWIGLKVNESDGSVTINEKTTILAPNLLAWNGIIHEIDSFLAPPETGFPTPQPKDGGPTTPSAPASAPSIATSPTAPDASTMAPAPPTLDPPTGGSSPSAGDPTSDVHASAESVWSVLIAVVIPGLIQHVLQA